MCDGLAGNSAGLLQGRTVRGVCEVGRDRVRAVGVRWPMSSASGPRVKACIPGVHVVRADGPRTYGRTRPLGDRPLYAKWYFSSVSAGKKTEAAWDSARPPRIARFGGTFAPVSDVIRIRAKRNGCLAMFRVVTRYFRPKYCCIRCSPVRGMFLKPTRTPLPPSRMSPCCARADLAEHHFLGAAVRNRIRNG